MTVPKQPGPIWLHYLLLPARPTGLMLIGVLTLGFTLCAHGGLLAIPAQVLLLFWLFAYGYVLLEHVAHGAREPPVLAVEMVNPATELRPLMQFAFVMAAYLGLRALSGQLGAPWWQLIEGAALAALPASMAVLGVGQPFWRALDPLMLARIVRALGLSYFGLIVVALAYAHLIRTLLTASALPAWLVYALACFAWLSICALLGGALYEHREALGHEAIHAPERLAMRLQQQLDRERARFVDAVYAQARGGNLPGAWQTLERELSARGHDFACYDWLLERLARHDDQRLANRLGQDYVHRALGHDNGRVVEIVRSRLGSDREFHPRSAAETLHVATLARLAGDRAVAEQLLAGLVRHFADAPPSVIAAAEAERQSLSRSRT